MAVKVAILMETARVIVMTIVAETPGEVTEVVAEISLFYSLLSK